MRFVGRYLDEIDESELSDVVIKHVDDRLDCASRQLVIREKTHSGVTEITVSRVLTTPID